MRSEPCRLSVPAEVERKSLPRAASFYSEAALALWKVMISLLQHGQVTCSMRRLSVRGRWFMRHGTISPQSPQDAFSPSS